METSSREGEERRGTDRREIEEEKGFYPDSACLYVSAHFYSVWTKKTRSPIIRVTIAFTYVRIVFRHMLATVTMQLGF